MITTTTLVPPRRAGAGAFKQANVRHLPALREQVPINRYRPPSPPANARILVVDKKKKREADSAESDSPMVTAHAIPISEFTSRTHCSASGRTVGQLAINKLFCKSYMALALINKLPVQNMTLSSLWHAVSERTN
jgi:hypothetical protein